MNQKQPPTPEQPLPEELVSKHLDVLEYPRHNAEITIDYMGRFAEWVTEAGYIKSFGSNTWLASTNVWLTTPQLIELFFNQQSK